MRCRHYLGALAAAAVAGCSDVGDPAPEDTPTPDPEDGTETETPAEADSPAEGEPTDEPGGGSSEMRTRSTGCRASAGSKPSNRSRRQTAPQKRSKSYPERINGTTHYPITE